MLHWSRRRAPAVYGRGYAGLLLCLVLAAGCSGGQNGSPDDSNSGSPDQNGGGTGPTTATSTVTGTLVDATYPMIPISDAYIYVPRPRERSAEGPASWRAGSDNYAQTYSGPDGSYTLADIPNGVVTIVVVPSAGGAGIEPPPSLPPVFPEVRDVAEGAGYAPAEFTVDLGSGASTSITLHLRLTLLPLSIGADHLNITLDPPNAVVAPGDTLQYRATIMDDALQTRFVAPTWLVTSAAGTIDEKGLFTAGSEPAFGTVTAQVGDYVGTTEVTVGTPPDTETHPNRSPIISSIRSSPDSPVSPGDEVSLTCEANDPDDDPLTYVWDATGGSVSGSYGDTTWVAPSSPADYVLRCLVSDDEGASDMARLVITVEGEPDGGGGGGEEPPPETTGALQLDAAGYMGIDAVAEVTVTDGDQAGAGAIDVTVTSDTTDPEGETIVLTESATPGVFVGAVGFERPFDQLQPTPLVSGDGRIGVYAEGDRTSETLTVTYHDATTESGDPADTTVTVTYEEPTSTLTGVVRDSITHAGITGAVVDIEELGWQAVTRSGAGYEGHYSFYDVPSGTYTLTVVHQGHVIRTYTGVVVP